MDQNEISQFRQNLQDMFARELAITIVPGMLEGANDTFGETIGSVYVRRIQENPARVAEQQVFVILRVYLPFSSSAVVSQNQPLDPTPLEDMAGKILDAIARNQTGLGAWFQRVTAIDIDIEDQGVQAQILAYSQNDGVAA
jgi:hypothetical protein